MLSCDLAGRSALGREVTIGLSRCRDVAGEIMLEMRNKDEAREIVAAELERLRSLSRDELLRYVNDPHASDVTGESGTTFQLEVQAFWDDRKHENLRVVVSIDDGGISAFVPMSDDFIVAPNGSFVGE